jgi:hypothetical protein
LLSSSLDLYSSHCCFSLLSFSFPFVFSFSVLPISLFFLSFSVFHTVSFLCFTFLLLLVPSFPSRLLSVTLAIRYGGVSGFWHDLYSYPNAILMKSSGFWTVRNYWIPRLFILNISVIRAGNCSSVRRVAALLF